MTNENDSLGIRPLRFFFSLHSSTIQPLFRLPSGWWFGCHFLFSHILGISSSQLTNSYFSEGWPNHQPAISITHWSIFHPRKSQALRTSSARNLTISLLNSPWWVCLKNRASQIWTGVGKCPFLGILKITFKYMLEIISPIVGWCSIGTFTNPVEWDYHHPVIPFKWLQLGWPPYFSDKLTMVRRPSFSQVISLISRFTLPISL